MFETARWKRKESKDYKFDDVNVDEFVDHSCLTSIRYPFVYLQALKAILIYMADLAIMGLLFYTQIRKELDASCGTDVITGVDLCSDTSTRWSENLMPYEYRPYIQLVSIMMSFLFLVLDWRKALKVIQSRGISVAFTSNIANRFYSLRSYPHFCFFLEIRNSRKALEVVAFWVFFILKGWRRVLIAEMPRQAINFLTVVDVIDQQRKQSQYASTVPDVFLMLRSFGEFFTNPNNDLRFKFIYGLQMFTISLWTISFLLLAFGMISWIPLACSIRGNLKEYICHIVDKRLDGLLKQRAADDESEHGTWHGSEHKGSTIRRERTAASSVSDAQPHWPGTEIKMHAPPTPYMQHQQAGYHFNQQQVHQGQWGHYDRQMLAPPALHRGGPPSPTVSNGSNTLPPYATDEFPSAGITKYSNVPPATAVAQTLSSPAQSFSRGPSPGPLSRNPSPAPFAVANAQYPPAGYMHQQPTQGHYQYNPPPGHNGYGY